MSPKRHFLEPLLRPGSASHGLVIERTGSILAQELEMASDSRTRRRGLLGRPGLAAGSAMIIAPCNAIHTFFMRFTIDVVFVNRQGQVVKLCPHLGPWRIGVGLRAFAAIELAAGSIQRCGIAKGDRLSIAQD